MYMTDKLNLCVETTVTTHCTCLHTFAQIYWQSPMDGLMMASWKIYNPDHLTQFLGSIPGWGKIFLCGFCMFLPCLNGFPPTMKTCMLGWSHVAANPLL